MKPTHLLTMKDGTEYKVYYSDESCGWIDKPDSLDSVFNNRMFHSLTPLSEPKAKEPERFNWKEAARLWSEGVEIEYTAPHSGAWGSITHDNNVYFDREYLYRRKPAELVVEKRYRETLHKGCYYKTLEACQDRLAYKAIAYEEITFHDGIPVSAKIIPK